MKLIEERLNERAKAALIQRLEIVVKFPVDPKMLNTLEAGVRESLPQLERNGQLGILASLGVAPPSPSASPPAPLAVRWPLDKQDFNLMVPPASGLANIIAEDLARRMTIQIFGRAERDVAVDGAAVKDLGTLRERIVEAAGVLRAAGHAPNLVLIPDDDEFRAALFGARYWNRLGAGNRGRPTLGD
jgi:hypothetical protein